jgi:hypothetical protein
MSAKKTSMPQTTSKGTFSFELLRPYPEARAFVIKKPLKSSMVDAVLDLLGSGSKR